MSLNASGGLAVDGALGVTGSVTIGLTLTSSGNTISLAGANLVLGGATLCVFGVSTVGGTSFYVNDTIQAVGTSSIPAFQTGNIGIYSGTGVPVVAASNGSIYLRLDGGAAGQDAFYIRSNNTWTALT